MDTKPLPDFYEKVKNQAPRLMLVKALEYVLHKDFVLDLGAGNLNESRYLLDQGFNRVVAVDQSSFSRDFATEVQDPRFKFTRSKIESFEFPENNFDAIFAMYVLPFISREDIQLVVDRIYKSLKQGGIFAGNFFGPKHDWGKETHQSSFYTKDEVEKMLAPFTLIKFLEKEHDRDSIDGKRKEHFHQYHFIVKKD
jgi:SAM-dependent methyltransferase